MSGADSRRPAWRPSPASRSGASTPSAPAPTAAPTPSSSASRTGTCLWRREPGLVAQERPPLLRLLWYIRFLFLVALLHAFPIEQFWKHYISRLAALNKYNISDIKDCCEESLLEDKNSSNVPERLHVAWLYRLEKLKNGCLAYLFVFGKTYDVRDEINSFFHHADCELMLEMFQEVLTKLQNFDEYDGYPKHVDALFFGEMLFSSSSSMEAKEICSYLMAEQSESKYRGWACSLVHAVQVEY
ncbi:hypothetical protein ABZP36_027163 [Zizania latifolia]